MTKLFIGLPVYNGEAFIKEAIDSIRNQTFTDWIMLISDNCSEDNTEEICLEYCKMDPRIKFIKQAENIGAQNNFGYVLNSSNCEYFMWGAHDDLWDFAFISSCINNLENNLESNLAFCNMVNTDSYNKIIRDDYPCFSRFNHKFQLINIIRFILEPEIYGKCNFFCGVYRTTFCKEIWEIHLDKNIWGTDNCFVLAALARTRLSVDKRVLFEKRIDRPTDKPDEVEKIFIENPKENIFPMNEAGSYLSNNLKVLKGTKYYYIGLILVTFRYLALFRKRLLRAIKLLRRYH